MEWDKLASIFNFFNLIWLSLTLLSICVIIVHWWQSRSKEISLYVDNHFTFPFSGIPSDSYRLAAAPVYLCWGPSRALKSRLLFLITDASLLEALGNVAEEEKRFSDFRNLINVYQWVRLNMASRRSNSTSSPQLSSCSSNFFAYVSPSSPSLFIFAWLFLEVNYFTPTFRLISCKHFYVLLPWAPFCITAKR